MESLKNKTYQVVFKTIVAALYLVLFVTQCTGKFYFYANARYNPKTADAQVAKQNGSYGHEYSIYSHKNSPSFSLDKRFHAKLFCTGCPQQYGCGVNVVYAKQQFNVYSQAVINSSHLTILSRGPPSLVACNITVV